MIGKEAGARKGPSQRRGKKKGKTGPSLKREEEGLNPKKGRTGPGHETEREDPGQETRRTGPSQETDLIPLVKAGEAGPGLQKSPRFVYNSYFISLSASILM